MSHTAIIKLAPIATAERMNDPAWTRPDRLLLWRNAVGFLPNRDDAPLVVDHNLGLELGRVNQLFTLDWVDGPWLAARCELADPPDWLQPFRTRASFARFDVHEVERRVVRAFLKEVSLCLATEPSEPGAELLSLKRTKAVPAVIDSEPELLIRPGIGQVLGVR